MENKEFAKKPEESKIKICESESSETVYWLKIIKVYEIH